MPPARWKAVVERARLGFAPRSCWPARAWFLQAFFAALGLMLQAPTLAGAEVNLFGNDFATPATPRPAIKRKSASGVAAPREDYPETLLFHNGKKLLGELAEVTKDEVVWRRKDASELLRFPRADVRRVLLATTKLNSNARGTNDEDAVAKGPAVPTLATVKLAGSDWLRGALTSADGETFQMTLTGGVPLEFAREQVQWLHFGPNAAPAFELGEGALALEGWTVSGTPRIKSEAGTTTIQDVAWVGHALATPSRFEIDFEVPEDGEDGLGLWLQPFDPQPNSYSDGTVMFRLGRKELSWTIYHGDLKEKKVELPAEAQSETGPKRYRVLYDGSEERVLVLRNGRELGNFSLKPKDPLPPGEDRRDRLPRGLCFDRNFEEKGKKFQFRQLGVRPWDGSPPKAGEQPAAEQDWLSLPKAPPVFGQLKSVAEKELVFAEKSVAVAPETFVQFSQTPSPLADAEATLSLGGQGDVNVTGLTVREGRVRGRSVFAPALELPASTLQRITFARGKTAAPTAGDLLVFKNGDELSGALIHAATGSPLRWRLSNGQEIEFQPERIAGVRLVSAGPAPPAGTIELRNGERLRGTVAAFDAQGLRWQHSLLGELTISRPQLWRLYPNPDESLRDGGQEPERWLKDSAGARRIFGSDRVRKADGAWVTLDGRFVLRARDGNGGEQTQGPALELSALARYELRVDLASSSDPGTLYVSFAAPKRGGVMINLSSYSLYLYVQSPKTNGFSTNRNVRLQDKIGERPRMLSLRAFVDDRAGTIDFFVNGFSVGRIGQSAAERVPGVGQNVTIDSYNYGRGQSVLADVTVVPWSGELPQLGDAAPMTVLSNGDVAGGTPTSLTEGRWKIESEIGPLDLPVGKVQAVEFGGAMQLASAAGRLRLTDGSALLVERFAWGDGQLTAQHATFGELHLPGSAVGELIFDPAPARPPIVADPKKIARKDDPADP